ncbi:MAG: flagellar hook-associated protein FlgK [Undibacterium sp.]|nr:flagellar hook-associated protein FlgK [Opitutaceae bacterium]
MSGLYASLNSTVKALSAHSRALEIAGKNIANVDNAGYARQRVVYGDRGTVLTTTGAESLGLEALGVDQMRDALLDRQVLREVALKSGFAAEQAGYQRAQAGLGQSIDRTQTTTDSTATGTGVAGAIDGFFNAFQGFAANPTGVGERQVLLQQSSILSDRLQLTDQRLAQTQSDLNAGIATNLDDANRILASIAELNSQIGRFEVDNPNSAVDLRDQRQNKLEELAAILPIEVRPQPGGQVQVIVKDGSGTDVPLVDLATVQGTLAFDGTNITGGSPAATLALSSGSIKGSRAARDGGVQILRDNLDLLARQLVTAVNSAYNPTGTTGDFFAAAGTAASTFAVDAGVTATNLKASDTTAAGDNTLALAVAALANQKFATAGGDVIDGTLPNFFSQSVSNLGQSLSGANSRVDDQTNIEKLVRSQRDSVSGVSLDEELADLMKFQRAFQASSRVFSVIDELLDNVVNSLGR